STAPQARTFTIGLVSLTPVLDPALDAFKARMDKDFHYKEGVNVKYIYARKPGTPTVSPDQILDNLKALMAPDVALVAAMNTAAVQKRKELSAASGKPIIFMGVWDPINVSPQIVSNLSQPGGNITGVRGGGSEFKRVEWFKKIVPDIKRLYAPYRE